MMRYFHVIIDPNFLTDRDENYTVIRIDNGISDEDTCKFDNDFVLSLSLGFFLMRLERQVRFSNCILHVVNEYGENDN